MEIEEGFTVAIKMDRQFYHCTNDFRLLFLGEVEFSTKGDPFSSILDETSVR